MPQRRRRGYSRDVVPSLLGIVGMAVVAAQEPTALTRRVDEAVEQARAQHQIPGLSVAVVVNGARVYAKGFGTASLSEAKLVTADTQYRLASVSKAFTAVAILKLVEQGKLDLDRPAGEYCPELQRLNGAPTVRHLLAHQSGLRHTSDDEDTSIKGPVSRLGAALDRVVKERLRFQPGTKTLYTSWGYAALGCVIETVSGQSYGTFLKEHVLDPVGLRDTTIDEPSYAGAQFSPGFRLRGGKLVPSDVVDTRFKTPASGLISTVIDLSHFASALFGGSLLPPRLFQEMLSVPPLPAAERPRFTAGWTLGQPGLGAPAYEYNGSMEGSTAYLFIVPAKRVAVALLANRERFVPEVYPIVVTAARVALEGK